MADDTNREKEAQYKRILTTRRVTFVENMIVTELYHYLIQYHITTTAIISRIKEENKVRADQVGYLLEHLATRPLRDLELFIEALRETNQGSLADLFVQDPNAERSREQQGGQQLEEVTEGRSRILLQQHQMEQIVGLAVMGIKRVCRAVESVKKNSSRCNKLKERLSYLEPTLNVLKQHNDPDVKRWLTNFTKFLDELSNYITELQGASKLQQGATAFLTDAAEKKLDELTGDLKDHMDNINTLLNSRTNRAVEQNAVFQPVTSAAVQQEKDEVDGNLSEADILAALEKIVGDEKKTGQYLELLYIACKANSTDSPVDYLVGVFLAVTKTYPQNMDLQMTAIAGIYQLIDTELPPTLPVPLASRIMNACIGALENFPQNEEVCTNALWTLNEFIYLDIATFNNLDVDLLHCATVLMNTFSAAKRTVLLHISLHIGNRVLKRVQVEQVAKIGSPALMKKVLWSAEQAHIGMKTAALDILVSLTDECPPNCQILVQQNFLVAIKAALQIKMEQTEELKDAIILAKRALLCVSNVAEVKQLRPFLMQDDLLLILSELLQTGADMAIKYQAGCALAAILTGTGKTWTLKTKRETILKHLEEAVLSWPAANVDIGIYYSALRSFREYLAQYAAPAIQIWWLWTLDYLLTDDGARYGPMIFHDGIDEVLASLSHSSSNQTVLRLCTSVLEAADQYQAVVYTPVHGPPVN